MWRHIEAGGSLKETLTNLRCIPSGVKLSEFCTIFGMAEHAAEKCRLQHSSVPQPLKPGCKEGIYGTTEVVPFPNVSFFAACEVVPFPKMGSSRAASAAKAALQTRRLRHDWSRDLPKK